MKEQPLSTEEALELYLSNRSRGDKTSPEEFAARHAELGPELGSALQALAALESATPSAQDAAIPHEIGAYRVVREIGRGGMGVILRVWDEELGRHLAMKVALGGAGSPAQLVRFLEEARVTGQLDHPGIVPVHELGLDAEGRRFFTMKLVEGRDMKQVFELVFAGRDGWNETRALGVILKVCEAMAYAHSKGIIHRDLKPANVMVGGFGEVFVMDWGLARVLNRADSGAAAAAEPASDSQLFTLDGSVLGTPAYMPPEQARGEIDRLSPRSDVYSIGAMLYHLLARQAPHVPPQTRSTPREVLARVKSAPPTPLHQLNPAVPAELVAICEKAMAQDPARRYADTLAFAEDLRAYLEKRVVAAYETGALAELRKWIARNRALAAACGAAVLILAVGLVVSSSLFVTARRERERANAKTADVLSLSAERELQELVERADSLWPVSTASVSSLEAWLRDAHALVEGRAADTAHGIKAAPGLSGHKQKLAELGARASGIEDSEDRWWRAQLTSLVADLEAFASPESGLCGRGTDPVHGWGVEKRLEIARTIEERSVTGPMAAQRWREAIASIQDRAQCPKYEGLVITPQLGLLPIGQDPHSGLWEFAHLPTGEPAERAADGSLALHEGLGLVFVLIPAGTFWMGAQKSDPAGHNFDPLANPIESPVHEVRLDAFFLSKYEVTQDQWLRFTGINPSVYKPGTVHGGITTTSLHPVEQLSWRGSTAVLRRLELLLPTEAQWEYAARAGTSTAWWTGAEKSSLAGAANTADHYASTHNGPVGWGYDDSLDDGYEIHAPIGSFRANAFGLHDVAGNVYELCREGYGTYDLPERAGDGERQGTDPVSNMLRGGAYHNPPHRARSAYRTDVPPDYTDYSLGVRPVRSLAR